MPRWTAAELAAYEARRLSSRSQFELAVRAEPVAAPARETGDPSRVRVRVVSFRRKLCDPDNLCPKYFVDCLRYAGLIPDDREADIILEVRQVRVAGKTEERTEVEVGG